MYLFLLFIFDWYLFIYLTEISFLISYFVVLVFSSAEQQWMFSGPSTVFTLGLLFQTPKDLRLFHHLTAKSKNPLLRESITFISNDKTNPEDLFAVLGNSFYACIVKGFIIFFQWLVPSKV